MDFIIQTILTIINSVSPEEWELVAEAAVASLAVTGWGSAVKRFFSVHGKVKLRLLIIAGSFLASAVIYVTDSPLFGGSQVAILTTSIFTLTQIFHPLFKALGRRISAHLQKIVDEAEPASKAALEPASGLPATPVITDVVRPSADDFSH